MRHLTPSGALAFALALALGLGLGARGASATVIDGTVAAVESRVIALSTLAAYREAFPRTGSAADALKALIDDRLLAREATRYGQALPKNALAKAERARRAPAGLSQEEWRTLLGDHLLAKQFLNFRFGDYVPVGQEEIRGYYMAHRAEFGSRPFAAVEDAIRLRLLPAARATRQAAFIDDLRSRTAIRINGELLSDP